MYELMGWEGTGNLLYVTCHCRMSKAGGTVLYIDGENAVDKNIFKN
jgi:hypothetical protein